MSKDGFTNEVIISKHLDKKNLKDLNPNLKEFIRYVANKEKIELTEQTSIKSTVINDNSVKPDINVWIDTFKFSVSIKMGSGNSVHQEKIESFLSYLKNELNAPTEIIDGFDWFINDLDDARTLKKHNPTRVQQLNDYLELNKKEIIIRFLKNGLRPDYPADYIYYGTYTKGTWSRMAEAIDVAISKSKPRSTMSVGTLGVQAWNRTNEQKRHVIQAKWTTIEADLNEAKKV